MLLFYERMQVDEDSLPVNNHTVYRDLMVFFKLIERDMFGGRVLVTKGAPHKNTHNPSDHQ